MDAVKSSIPLLSIPGFEAVRVTRVRLSWWVALLLGVLLPTLLPVGVAYAGKSWCSTDPAVTVWVDGRPVTVNTFVAVPIEHLALLPSIHVSGAATGDTVTVTVQGPPVEFKAYAQIGRLGLSQGDPNVEHPAGSTVQLTFTGVSPLRRA